MQDKSPVGLRVWNYSLLSTIMILGRKGNICCPLFEFHLLLWEYHCRFITWWVTVYDRRLWILVKNCELLTQCLSDFTFIEKRIRGSRVTKIEELHLQLRPWRSNSFSSSRYAVEMYPGTAIQSISAVIQVLIAAGWRMFSEGYTVAC
jgi:hypothetical protein